MTTSARRSTVDSRRHGDKDKVDPKVAKIGCHPKGLPQSRRPSTNRDFGVFAGSHGDSASLVELSTDICSPAAAIRPEQDLLVVDAEAFVRDADPDDFSLDAMIAHERGHQITCRNLQLQRFLVGKVAPATEEILASLIASWLVEDDRDSQSLVLKALDEALQCGLRLLEATDLVKELRALLEYIE